MPTNHGYNLDRIGTLAACIFTISLEILIFIGQVTAEGYDVGETASIGNAQGGGECIL